MGAPTEYTTNNFSTLKGERVYAKRVEWVDPELLKHGPKLTKSERTKIEKIKDYLHSEGPSRARKILKNGGITKNWNSLKQLLKKAVQSGDIKVARFIYGTYYRNPTVFQQTVEDVLSLQENIALYISGHPKFANIRENYFPSLKQFSKCNPKTARKVRSLLYSIASSVVSNDRTSKVVSDPAEQFVTKRIKLWAIQTLVWNIEANKLGKSKSDKFEKQTSPEKDLIIIYDNLRKLWKLLKLYDPEKSTVGGTDYQDILPIMDLKLEAKLNAYNNLIRNKKYDSKTIIDLEYMALVNNYANRELSEFLYSRYKPSSETIAKRIENKYNKERGRIDELPPHKRMREIEMRRNMVYREQKRTKPKTNKTVKKLRRKNQNEDGSLNLRKIMKMLFELDGSLLYSTPNNVDLPFIASIMNDILLLEHKIQ